MAAVISFKRRASELRSLAAQLRSVTQSFKSLGRERDIIYKTGGTTPGDYRLALSTRFDEYMAVLDDIRDRLAGLSFVYPLEVRISPKSLYVRATWVDSSSVLTVNDAGDSAFDADGTSTTHLFSSGDVVRITGNEVIQSESGGVETNIFVCDTQTTSEADLVLSLPATLVDGNESNLKIELIEG